MDVVSTGALPVASLIWQPRIGVWVQTIVCRATFVLRPGECSPAARQEPPAEEDRQGEGEGAQSLHLPRDLVPVKPHADVLLVGHVHAPEHRPARVVEARLVAGEIDKRIEAIVERTLGQDGSVHEGQPFSRMKLCYERTGGGPGTTNPVGVRRDVRSADGSIALPTLQRPGASLSNAFEPVGFGPLATTFPERRDRLAALGRRWSFEDLALPLPDGMDLGFFNAAPRDQQLRGFGARIDLVLENLHAEHARLATSLSTAAPRAVVERREGSSPLALRADTLWIDTDRSLCTLTFRGSVPLGAPDAPGRVIVSADYAAPPREVMAPRGDAPPPVARPPRKLEATADIPLEVRRGAMANATLPFAAAAAPQARAAHASSPSVDAQVASAPPPVMGAPVLPIAPVLGVGVAVAVAPAPQRSPVEVAAKPGAREGASAGESLELVWFDPESVPRARRKAAWRPILDQLERTPLDPELDDPAFAKDPMHIEERREVFEVLAHAPAVRADALDQEVSRCTRDDGKFVPSLVLVSGELELPFDELAALRATLTTVAPLVGSDEALKASVQAAKDFLATPGLMSAPAVAEGLTKRIEDAFAAGKRVVPAGYLEAQRERALVEQRQYQRRSVFGGKRLRALLRVDGADPGPPKLGRQPAPSSTLVPTYLPEDVADALPMFPRFRVRLIAELRLAADRYEAHPAALRALALARVASNGRSGPS
jgi:hypothetical protein